MSGEGENGSVPAVEGYDANSLSALDLTQLREELSARGLEITGLKSELVKRLEAALAQEQIDLKEAKFSSPPSQHLTSSHLASPQVSSAPLGAPAKLFVGQLPPTTNEEILRNVFSVYGKVTEVVILTHRDTGNPKGCAFVSFESRAEADKAIAALHGQVKLTDAKRELIVRYAGVRPAEEEQGNQEHKLYVGMLSRKSTEEDIRKMFEPYGIVQEVHLMRQPDSGLSKGAAFIKYNGRDEAQRAITALHGKVKDGEAPGVLQVRFAHTKMERVAQMSSSRNMALFQTPSFSNPYMPSAPLPPIPGADGQWNWNTQPAYGGYGSQAANPLAQYGMPSMLQGGNMGKDVRGPPGCNLFIYNVPDAYSDLDLASLFTSFGGLVSTKVQRDKVTGASKGFGFASFDNPKSTQAAIASLDGFVVAGKKLNVRLKKETTGGSFNPY